MSCLRKCFPQKTKAPARSADPEQHSLLQDMLSQKTKAPAGNADPNTTDFFWSCLFYKARGPAWNADPNTTAFFQDTLSRKITSPCEVRRPEAAVEARNVGIGLLESRVLLAGERQVADDVEAVPAAGRPAGHDRDHDLRHESDQALDLENVEAPEPSGIDLALSAFVLIAVHTADALVTP